MSSSLKERRTTNNNSNRLNLSRNQDGDKLFPVNEENGLNVVELKRFKTVSPDTESGKLEVRNRHSFSSGNLTPEQQLSTNCSR